MLCDGFFFLRSSAIILYPRQAAGWLLYLLTPLLGLTPLGPLRRSQALSGARLARLALGSMCAGATAAYVADEAVSPSSAWSRTRPALCLHGVRLWERSLAWAAVTPRELKAAGLLRHDAL